MRFQDQIAYDWNYQGPPESSIFFPPLIDQLLPTGLILSPEEGNRLADVLGDKSILMMGNHGVLGSRIAWQFVELSDTFFSDRRVCGTCFQHAVLFRKSLYASSISNVNRKNIEDYRLESFRGGQSVLSWCRGRILR